MKRCSYKKISEQIRMKIIEKIINEGQNIKEVAEEMNVNISTCKAILKVYQQQGRVGKKKRRNKVYNVIETFSFYTIDHSQLKQLGEIKVQESKVSLEREEDCDKKLENMSKNRAEELLQTVMQNSRPTENQQSLSLNSHFMQSLMMQNAFMQYFHNPFLFNEAVKKQQPDFHMPSSSISQDIKQEIKQE